MFGIHPSTWPEKTKDTFYWMKYGIDFPELDKALTFDKAKLYEIFYKYIEIFPSKSFTKEELKTRFFKVKKEDDLQLDGFCDRIFQIYDTGRKGKINFEEFAVALDVQLHGKVVEKLNLLFDLTDQDSNGLLSERELSDMLTAFYNRKGVPEPRKKGNDLAKRIIDRSEAESEMKFAQFLLATHSQDIFMDVYELFQSDFPSDSRYKDEPPVHWMMRMDKYDICLRLLLNNTDPNWPDTEGNTALHIAAKTGKKDYVRMLIAFGADVNLENNKKQTARHLAATAHLPNNDKINTLLHTVGAKMCPPDMGGCQANCSTRVEVDSLDGNMPKKGQKSKTKKPRSKDVETVFSHITADDETDAIESPEDQEEDKEEKKKKRKEKEIHNTVLCLDGGGIRGLVLIQALMEIEKQLQAESGPPPKIRDCFDWIGGTSTGGILALAITKGISLQGCRRLYFQLKDSVFASKIVAKQTEQLVTLLKRTFGNEVKLCDDEMVKDRPKILLTTVRMSIDDEKTKHANLRLLRNYTAPPKVVGYDDVDAIHEPIEHVWLAAQATSAAPMYFERVHKVFVDGGLMANNPTLEVLTDIMEYRAQVEQKKKIAIGAVVSLGTGQGPISGLLPSLDPILSLNGFTKEMKETLDFFYNEATKTEGTVVSRSKAWCDSAGVPYFRLNPSFEEDIDLAERDNKKLVKMLHLTAVYLHEEEEKVSKVANLLSKRYEQRQAAAA